MTALRNTRCSVEGVLGWLCRSTLKRHGAQSAWYPTTRRFHQWTWCRRFPGAQAVAEGVEIPAVSRRGAQCRFDPGNRKYDRPG